MELIEPRPLAIIAALKEELAAIKLRLRNPRQVKTPGGSYLAGTIDGQPVALIKTGMGLQPAREAAEWVFRELAPIATLSTGFAGGLRDDLRPGDLVLATEVFDPPPPDGQGPRAFRGDSGLFEIAKKIVKITVVERTGKRQEAQDLRVVEGRMATVRKALTRATEKRAFGERQGAIAVDMESTAIAQVASAIGARVIYLRAIIDEVDFNLPLEDFSKIMTADGRLKPLPAIGAILSHPSALLALGKLRKRALLGAENLAAFVTGLVSVLGSQS